MSLLSAGDVYLMNATLEEIANASLIEIATPDTLDAYGDPGSAVVVWTGEVDAYLLTRDIDVLSAGTEVQVQKTTLRVFDAEGATVAALRAGADWSAATVVVVDRRGVVPVQRRWTVVAMEHESDQTLNSVSLTLNDERDP